MCERIVHDHHDCRSFRVRWHEWERIVRDLEPGQEWPRQLALIDMRYHDALGRWPSQHGLARRWGWGRTRVRTLLAKLEWRR